MISKMILTRLTPRLRKTGSSLSVDEILHTKQVRRRILCTK